MCDCKSYNFDGLPSEGKVFALWARGGWFPCDKCLESALQKIVDAGYETYGSCCGHNGKMTPSIVAGNNLTECDKRKILSILDNEADHIFWSYRDFGGTLVEFYGEE